MNNLDKPEQAELTEASRAFSVAMLRRLRAKEKAGWSGWDAQFYAADIHERMETKVKRLRGEVTKSFRFLVGIEEALVDIGNYAMMLRHLYTEKLGGGRSDG